MVVLAWLGAGAAHADGLQTLERFVRGTQSARAEFTQVVTAPAREGQAARAKTSSGSFEFLRPERFRFQYRKPFEQLILSDGQTLWLHDPDLRQATARKLKDALGSSPAALIAAAPDLTALRAEFRLESEPERDGQEWVLATPRSRDGALQSVRVGFAGGQLSSMEIVDSFGQRSLLRFTRMEVNAPLSADAFQFKPPAGTDVIRP